MIQASSEQKLKKYLIFALWPVAVLLLFLAAVELSLRLYGFAAALRDKPSDNPSHAGSGRTILCAGDSFVYGVGGEPFPKQLEEILNETQSKLKFKVVNVGRPGTGSQQMLEHLEAQLQEYNPNYLIVLTESSHVWTELALKQETESGGILSHLKLYKLLNTARQQKKAQDLFKKVLSSPVATPPAGCASEYPNESSWWDNNRSGYMQLASAEPQIKQVLDYAQKAHEALTAAARLAEANNISGAEKALAKAAGMTVSLPATADARAKDLARRTREAVLFQHAITKGHLYINSAPRKALDAFKEVVRIRPDYLYGHLNILRLYDSLQNEQGYLKYAKKIAAKYPDSVLIHREMAEFYYTRAEIPLSLQAFKAALALVPCSSEMFNAIPYEYTQLEPFLPELEKDIPLLRYNNAYQKFKGMIRTTGTDQSSVTTLLDKRTERDILRAGELAKYHHAKLILSGYPELNVIGTLRAARKLDALHIDFVPIFKKHFRNRRDFIAYDNVHCNSAGYRLMAEQFAETIMKLEKQYSQGPI